MSKKPSKNMASAHLHILNPPTQASGALCHEPKHTHTSTTPTNAPMLAHPSLSLASTSARASTSRCTTPPLPLTAASCRGVRLSRWVQKLSSGCNASLIHFGESGALEPSRERSQAPASPSTHQAPARNQWFPDILQEPPKALVPPR